MRAQYFNMSGDILLVARRKSAISQKRLLTYFALLKHSVRFLHLDLVHSKKYADNLRFYLMRFTFLSSK
jgi:hypothetical protein